MFSNLDLKIYLKLLFIIAWLIYQVKCNFITEHFIKRIMNQINYDSVFKIHIINSKLGCAMQCSNLDKCWYFSYKDKECLLYDKLAKFYSNSSQQSFYYEKIKNGLEYYWPVHNSSVKEIIQGVDLTGGVNVSFTEDRFGNPNSAISFNSGYYVFPKSYYFGGEITVMGWVRSRNITTFMRVIDFGNGAPMENIILSPSQGLNGQPFFNLYLNKTTQLTVSSEPIKTTIWYHLAGVFKNNLMKIYINGTKKANNTATVQIGFRNNNFIGKSNWPDSVALSVIADYDDIKIFNRALTDSEIQEQYENTNL